MDISALLNQIQAIRNQVNNLNKKISSAQDSIGQLSDASRCVYDHQNQWDRTYQRAMNSRITAEVVIQGMFRGGVAEYLAGTFPDKVATMHSTCSKGNNVKAQIAVQIAKIREYITELQDKKNSLQRQISELSSRIAAARAALY